MPENLVLISFYAYQTNSHYNIQIGLTITWGWHIGGKHLGLIVIEAVQSAINPVRKHC